MAETRLQPAERQWRAALLLGWPLGIAALPPLLASGAPLCAFRAVTGQPCPLCGGTHACVALLTGDWPTAWQANPGVLLLVVVAAIHSALLAREALTGRQETARRWLDAAWLASGILLLAVWIARLSGSQ